jgi:hypothetical protein
MKKWKRGYLYGIGCPLGAVDYEVEATPEENVCDAAGTIALLIVLALVAMIALAVLYGGGQWNIFFLCSLSSGYQQWFAGSRGKSTICKLNWMAMLW